MRFKGQVRNGVVKLNDPQALPNGTKVEVRRIGTPKKAGAQADCFAILEARADFDPKALQAMRKDLTAGQYKALLAIASAGGPDLEAIRRIRAASLV